MQPAGAEAAKVLEGALVRKGWPLARMTCSAASTPARWMPKCMPYTVTVTGVLTQCQDPFRGRNSPTFICLQVELDVIHTAAVTVVTTANKVETFVSNKAYYTACLLW